jgi:hypothetical protein
MNLASIYSGLLRDSFDEINGATKWVVMKFNITR